jgi:hypothetical protein
MANCGDPRDKAPIIAGLDISSVARPRPVTKKSRERSTIKTEQITIVNDPKPKSLILPKTIMALPAPVNKNENRSPTPLEDVILNLFDENLAYYIDSKSYIYSFSGEALIVVGKYVGSTKLEELSKSELESVKSRLAVNYRYDNAQFVKTT